MEIDHCLAAIELVEDGLKAHVPQPTIAVARHQANAVGLQRVEGVLDLAKARLGIPHRECCEQAEPALVVGNHARGELVEPLRAHLQRAFVALAAVRGWPQSLAGPRVADGLRVPRSPPPFSGHVRSMRMDLSYRTPAPVSRQQPLLEKGCGVSQRTTSRDTPEAHQQLSPPRGTLRPLSPSGAPRSRGHRTSCEEPSSSAPSPSSAGIRRLRWIGGITRMDCRAPLWRVAQAPSTR